MGLSPHPGKKSERQNPPGVGLNFPEIHVNQADFSRVAHKLDGAVQAKLVHDIGAVIFDGFRADTKHLADFTGLEALCEQPHDFLFPGSQAAVLRIMIPGLMDRGALEGFDHFLGNGTV